MYPDTKGCETVGDWWQKLADAGDEDAKELLRRITEFRQRKATGMYDCVLCGEIYMTCNCDEGLPLYEVERARKQMTEGGGTQT
jgi:succinate dehydrogenase/fumarate reductase-like Fe-S protein